jgi:site-specific DNA-methyltransferase (adenine-specific)
MQMTDFINTIQQGDCLNVMKHINSTSIDLIYLDPPFFTEKTHALKTKDRSKEFSFDDIWGSDLAYTQFLYIRIIEMQRILKETGSIFVHCDKRGEHIIRAILDSIFGANHFRSEIIWSYKRWSNSKKGLLPAHQNIYFYSKTDDFKFNTLYDAYSETTNVDQILQKRTRDQHNKSSYAVDEKGDIKYSGEKKGVPLSDVWDIPYLNPKAKERVGYPTQKPLLLLEKVIEIASEQGDLILDPFCGSGTTCVAANLLKRCYIGIDKSSDAIQLSKQRLENPVKTESALLKKGRKSYLNADEEALSLLAGLKFNPVQRNQGIDAILAESFEDSPILVRVQKKHETLAEAAASLIKAKKTKQSKKVILIQTQENAMFDEDVYHEGLVIFQALSIQLKQYLKNH